MMYLINIFIDVRNHLNFCQVSKVFPGIVQARVVFNVFEMGMMAKLDDTLAALTHFESFQRKDLKTDLEVSGLNLLFIIQVIKRLFLKKFWIQEIFRLVIAISSLSSFLPTLIIFKGMSKKLCYEIIKFSDIVYFIRNIKGWMNNILYHKYLKKIVVPYINRRKLPKFYFICDSAPCHLKAIN